MSFSNLYFFFFIGTRITMFSIRVVSPWEISFEGLVSGIWKNGMWKGRVWNVWILKSGTRNKLVVVCQKLVGIRTSAIRLVVYVWSERNISFHFLLAPSCHHHHFRHYDVPPSASVASPSTFPMSPLAILVEISLVFLFSFTFYRFLIVMILCTLLLSLSSLHSSDCRYFTHFVDMLLAVLFIIHILYNANIL